MSGYESAQLRLCFLLHLISVGIWHERLVMVLRYRLLFLADIQRGFLSVVVLKFWWLKRMFDLKG